MAPDGIGGKGACDDATVGCGLEPHALLTVPWRVETVGVQSAGAGCSHAGTVSREAKIPTRRGRGTIANALTDRSAPIGHFVHEILRFVSIPALWLYHGRHHREHMFGAPLRAEIPNRITNHPLLVDDGDLRASESLVFAMIGNTRGPSQGPTLPRGSTSTKRFAVRWLITSPKAAQEGGPALLWMLGDYVRKGSAPGDWKAMDKALAAILTGRNHLVGTEPRQLRAIPVAGDREGDEGTGFGDAFPGVGADIAGRVARGTSSTSRLGMSPGDSWWTPQGSTGSR